jgi:antitoxin ParD1/3/4
LTREGASLLFLLYFIIKILSYASITRTNIPILHRYHRGLDMRLIAVHLPDRILDDIQQLVENGLYPNRSEAIRIAIRDLLKRELWDQNMFQKEKMSEVVG